MMMRKYMISLSTYMLWHDMDRVDGGGGRPASRSMGPLSLVPSLSIKLV